ncbi:MAG: response regulator [Deltaproteobacteria bacterium]|nr:response regulator [Deltaproteobacteria bacterium]
MGIFLGEIDDLLRGWEREALELERTADPTARANLMRSLFRTAHSLKGAARAVGVAPIEHACHELEHELGEARDGLAPLDATFVERWLRVGDSLREAAKRLRAGEVLETLPAPAQSELPPPMPLDTTQDLDVRAPVPVQSASPHVDGVRVLRVSAEKLDELITRVGDLLHAVARAEERCEHAVVLRELVGRLGDGDAAAQRDLIRDVRVETARFSAELGSDERAMRRATTELVELTRRLRVVPFGAACDGLERLVRDVVASGEKQVSFAVEGGDIQLDRAVAEGLRDPLRHLVRNALHHGIERPDVRRSRGKPPIGNVRVAATLVGSQVAVTVSDDGAGLDDEALRRNAPEGVVESDAGRLAFLPGVSTAARVSELAGRGVGLDVVKTRTESLQGQVAVEWTPGHGTRFTLRVPCSLATATMLLVRAAGQTFAIGATHVARVVRCSGAELRRVGGRLAVGPELTPVGWLGASLGLEPPPALEELDAVVLVALGPEPSPIALGVDEVLGVEDLVVRPLGPRLRKTTLVAGAAVLPNGRVALTLAPGKMVGAATASDAASDRARAAVRKKLLVVDDSLTTRSLARSILESAGFDVITAGDGLEAWRLLEIEGADLVVSDVEMPMMDGIALVRALRSSSRFARTPIVLLTARGSERDKARGLEAGADAYLVKSEFDQTELLDAIRRLV